MLLSISLLLMAAGHLCAAGFSFVQISDLHITCSGHFVENLTNVAGEVNAMNPQPAFVVVTGDQTETGLPHDWEKYRETARAFKMPVYDTSGNHETKWSNWGKASVGRFMGKNPPYSFDYENVHFIALDSSMWMQHHGLLDRSQLSWLKKDLEKAGTQKPSVLFYHHCPGFIPNEPELLKAIRPYNVRLILVGHGHTFKTWKKHNPGKSACGFNSPSVVENRFYSVAENGDVFAMDIADGKDLGTMSLGVSVYDGKPVIADGRVYAAGFRGAVACADLASGKKLWQYSTGSRYIFCPATLWEDLLIVPSADGSVTAIRL